MTAVTKHSKFIGELIAEARANGVPIVYLSGSIRKGDLDKRSPEHFWTEENVEALSSSVGGPGALLVNPATVGIRRSDPLANFGADLYLVENSDVVIVDARTEKGIGVGGEMFYAHSKGIPVITVAPPNTNYRRDRVENVYGETLSDWTHPFVLGLSTVVVDSFEAAGKAVRDLTTSQTKPPYTVRASVSHFLKASKTWA